MANQPPTSPPQFTTFFASLEKPSLLNEFSLGSPRSQSSQQGTLKELSIQHYGTIFNQVWNWNYYTEDSFLMAYDERSTEIDYFHSCTNYRIVVNIHDLLIKSDGSS